METTEDAGFSNEEQLSQYNVVVFLNTTGDILTDAQQKNGHPLAAGALAQAAGTKTKRRRTYLSENSGYRTPIKNGDIPIYYKNPDTGTDKKRRRTYLSENSGYKIPDTGHRSKTKTYLFIIKIRIPDTDKKRRHTYLL